MLTYDIGKRGRQPIYVYLYQCIRRDILDRRLRPGERLPSKRTLARHLDVSLISVTGAYGQLLTEGYIRSEEKKGYYVQDLSRYPEQAPAPQILYPPEPVEREYFVDFKANRISLQLFPSASWNHLMRQALSQDTRLLKTVPYNGLYELRLAITHYLRQSRGMEVAPSQVVVGAGTEYLYSRLMLMFGRNRVFAAEDPGYRKFASISANHGNAWLPIPIDENGLMVDKLEQSGAEVVHVSPANHFPTGIVMPITRRLELLQWVGRAPERYIIEDDYDSEFRYSGRTILPLYVDDTNNKVVYMNTFSKTLVPSLRISYMVLPPALIQRYSETMSFYSCTVSSFEQYALSRFIAEGYFERHINRIKNHYRLQRAKILSAIECSPLSRISTIVEHNAGTHFLLQVRTALSDEQIRQAALAADINLSLYSDYTSRSLRTPYRTLVINYAGIAPEKIDEVIRRLSSLFPECGASA